MPIYLQYGPKADREASAPAVSEIVVTKSMDKSSFAFMQEALIGKGIPATIHFVRTADRELQTYIEYKLENCIISGYSVSSGGDRPTENISINFTKIEYLFVELGIDNANKETPRIFYDLAKAISG
ncbi:MAG: type VI secretion system tube protein Hcp [Planctomycetes bacterium]|nr:type VI secretion system tube protein Hcp [Planctomycetota bacterium]